jgi:REP element-mobilizing transposase RayT
MPPPLAYLISWTTYGSWLPGDERGWVKDGQPGIQDPDPELRDEVFRTLAHEPVILTTKQRELVAQAIRRTCGIRKWRLHAVNVRTNHVHVVVTADAPPEDVMRVLKQWASKALSDQEGLTVSSDPRTAKKGRKRWWTEHGSTKWINDTEYFNNAVTYVLERQ